MSQKKIKRSRTPQDLKKLYAFFEGIDKTKLRRLVDISARQYYERVNHKPYNKRRVSVALQTKMLQGLKGYKTEEIEAIMQNFGIIPPPPEANKEEPEVANDDHKEYYIEGEKVSKEEYEKNGHKGGHVVILDPGKVK